MVRVLALDPSSKLGWSVMQSDQPFSLDSEVELIDYGLIQLPKLEEFGDYPLSYVYAANEMFERIFDGAFLKNDDDLTIDAVLFEEIQLSRGSRYAQKWLGILHGLMMNHFHESFPNLGIHCIDPVQWRKTLGIKLTKEDRDNNKRLKEAASIARAQGKKLDKSKLGVTGKISNKHLSVRWVNDNFNLDLRMKDNDTADAICIGAAYLRGAKLSNGK